MTSKEKKEYLLQYRNAFNEISDCLREKEELMDVISRHEKGTYEDIEKTKETDGTSKLKMLNRKIDERIGYLVDMREGIVSCIAAISNDTYRRVLKLRYIEGLKWDSIADIMHYDIDGKKIFSIHGKALLALKVDTERH